MTRRRPGPALLLLVGVLAVCVLLWSDAANVERTAPRGEKKPDEGAAPPLLRGAADPARRAAARAGPDARAGAAEGDASPEDDGDVRPSLLVETVDGLTGRTVAATWNLGSGRITAGPFPAGAVIDEAALARVREGVRASRAAWEEAFLPSGVARDEALFPGDAVNHTYVVRPRAGYVLDEASPHIVAELAHGVERTRLVVPVWEEAVLDLRVLDPEGRPASGVQIEALVAAGRLRRVVLEPRGPGEYRVRGIPRLPGEPVRASLLWGSVDESEEGHEVVEEMGEELDLEDAQVVSAVPLEPRVPWRVEVRLAGPRGAGWSTIESDNDLDYEESLGRNDAADTGVKLASLRVRALGWDGTRIPHATINGADTDAAGEILLRDLLPGEHWIEMQARGHLPAHRSFVLGEGDDKDVAVREPVGARLVVRVTDEKGRPRPFARLGLRGRKWFDVVGGEQRLDLFTDVRGRRAFERIEPGRTVIRATWGSRHGFRKISLPEGQTTEVHIVAK